MKRELRRVGAPPAETSTPRLRYLVPRHRWPAAWEALAGARAAFVTGLGQPAPALDCAAPVEVFVAERGVALLERLGARPVGAGGDPWIARLREVERLQRAAAEERARRDPAAQDELEAAFQREAERVRALKRAPAATTAPVDPPPRLTVTDAAAALGSPVETVRRWCRRGLLPGADRMVDGGTWTIPRSTVDDIIRRRAPMTDVTDSHAPEAMPILGDSDMDAMSTVQLEQVLAEAEARAAEAEAHVAKVKAELEARKARAAAAPRDIEDLMRQKRATGDYA